MKEQLITPETAKLAKKKGFISSKRADMYVVTKVGNRLSTDGPKWEEQIPTQSLLQKWIRDVHGINVIANTEHTLMWLWTIQSLHPKASYVGKYLICDGVWSTYEKALEEGLQKSLELIEL